MTTTVVTMPWGVEFSFVTEKCIGFNRYFEKCEGEITREFKADQLTNKKKLMIRPDKVKYLHRET